MNSRSVARVGVTSGYIDGLGRRSFRKHMLRDVSEFLRDGAGSPPSSLDTLADRGQLLPLDSLEGEPCRSFFLLSPSLFVVGRQVAILADPLGIAHPVGVGTRVGSLLSTL